MFNHQTINGDVNQTIYNITISESEFNKQTKVPLSVRVEPVLKKFLEKSAKAKGVTMSKYVEIVLLKYFRSEAKIKKLNEILKDLENEVKE